MHRLLFDQNLSYRIIQHIEQLFPESDHVRLLGLDKADDLTIWEYAKNHNFHIVTQDNDFTDISTLYGYPPKIIRISTGNTTTDVVIKLINGKQEIIKEFLDNKETGILEIE